MNCPHCWAVHKVEQEMLYEDMGGLDFSPTKAEVLNEIRGIKPAKKGKPGRPVGRAEYSCPACESEYVWTPRGGLRDKRPDSNE